MHSFPNDGSQMSNSKNPYEVLTDSHVLSIWLIFKESQVHILKAWGFTTVYLSLLTFPSVKVIPLDTCSNEKSTLGKKPLQSSRVHSWKALLTPALVSKEVKMSLLKEKISTELRAKLGKAFQSTLQWGQACLFTCSKTKHTLFCHVKLRVTASK